MQGVNFCTFCGRVLASVQLHIIGTDPLCKTRLQDILASAGNQFGTLVFFLADAPARYNAWDEFVLYSFYRLIAPSGNEFGAPVSFFVMRCAGDV